MLRDLFAFIGVCTVVVGFASAALGCLLAYRSYQLSRPYRDEMQEGES
jgi:hypothetical protein